MTVSCPWPHTMTEAVLWPPSAAHEEGPVEVGWRFCRWGAWLLAERASCEQRVLQGGSCLHGRARMYKKQCLGVQKYEPWMLCGGPGKSSSVSGPGRTAARWWLPAASGKNCRYALQTDLFANTIVWLAILIGLLRVFWDLGYVLWKMVKSFSGTEQEVIEVKHYCTGLAQTGSSQGTHEPSICPESLLTLVIVKTCRLIRLSLSLFPTAHTITLWQNFRCSS